jgi:hypothetical protein
MLYYICANIVYEDVSDTDVAIYQLDGPQYDEVRKALDSMNFINTDELSFNIDNLKTIPAPFDGRISLVGTFYVP